MINLNTLTQTQKIDAELFEVSLCGNYAIIASMSATDPDSLVWYVAETDGAEDWVEVYYAAGSIEDAQDVFSILDEADYETFFDLFNQAESAALVA